MKNLSKLSVLIFVIIFFNAQGQDYILKLDVGVSKTYCESITIKNDTIIFVAFENSVEGITTVDDMYAIHFYDNKPDELLLLSFHIDTVLSIIDSISSRYIYYRDSNRLLHSINKSDVFCILFHKDIYNPKIDSFYDKYLLLQKQNYNNNPKLIKRDGVEIEVLNLNSLVSDTINIELPSKQNSINTYALGSSLTSYINKEPVDRILKSKFNDFIYFMDDTLKEVKIGQFIDDKINYSLVSNDDIIFNTQNKKSITGIFFNDYPEKVEVYVPPVEEKPVIVKIKRAPSESKFTFDLGIGFGYMFNLEKSFNLPYENETHLNKLRLGMAFNVGAKMLVTKRFGIGVKYNQFNTSSTEQSISENITVVFAGGTLFGNIPIIDSLGLFNVDLSLGLLAKNEHFEIQNVPYYLKGKTVGVYVSTGLDFFVSNNISIGFNIGLLGGSLEKNDTSSDYDILPEKSNSLSRFDGMVTVKVLL